MSVQFIIGRAGTGKTAWCMEKTIAACRADALGAPILWLVPRQATFQTERDLCCGSDLQGFFRVRVVSFELLCRQVLADVGGTAAAEVSSQGRQMILGHLLRRHEGELRFFKRSGADGAAASGQNSSLTPHGGLSGEIDRALDELERGGADLTTLSARLPTEAANGALREKLRDLEMIHASYNAFLGEHRLDPDRRLRQAMEAFERCTLLQSATVYVDGFLHFTHRERLLLVNLARVCRSVSITLTIDPQSTVVKDIHQLPDDLSLFHGMETEYRKLRFALTQAPVKVEPVVTLNEVRRFQADGLRRVERWGNEGAAVGAVAEMKGVELVEAADKRTEVDFAARRVRDLLAAGYRYREITVLARQLSDYQDLIAAAFGEHDIPYFVDDRRSASHHPLVQFLRAAVAAAVEPWQGEAMTAILKSGLCGLSAGEADELENHVLLNGIEERAWSDGRPWKGSKAIELIDGLRRRIVEPLKPFIAAVNRSGQNVRQLCAVVFELLERFAVRQMLAKWIDESRATEQSEQAGEHEQVWKELVALFDQFVELLGDVQMTLADFSAALDGALGQFDLAIAPATLDQVLVGQVDRTRAGAVKAAIILGVSDGQFPQPPATQPILSDADRRALVGLADLQGDTARQALDEEFLGYFAFTRASEKLIVTRPISDDSGRELGPSSLWRKLGQMIGVENVKAAGQPDRLNPADITTPRQLISGVMQWARQEATGIDSSVDATWPVLYQWLAGDTAPSVARLRDLAWPALGYTNHAALSGGVSAQLFPAPLQANVWQLETFRACPFQHFARYGLRLAPRGVEGISNLDVARLCRDVMDRLLRDLLGRGENWCDLPLEEVNSLVGGMASEAALRFKSEATLGVPRNRYLLDQITRTLMQVIAAQRAAGLRGEFRPYAGHVGYGEGGQLPPLSIRTPGRKDVFLTGDIARVDVSADGKSAVLHDYRLSTHPLSLAEVYHGLSMKLIADLLAWENGAGRMHKQSPRAGAAFSTQMSRSVRDADDPEAAPAPETEEFQLLVKPRGLIDAHHAPRLDNSLAPGVWSDVAAMRLTIEAGFGNRNVTDIADTEEFKAILKHVRRRLGQLADKLQSGFIAVRPYKMGLRTPCAQCGFRDVCRFDPNQMVEGGGSPYVKLEPMKRVDVLKRVVEEAAARGGVTR